MPHESELDFDANLPAELVDVEAALQRFTPAMATVNRDELMYRAGWEAARTHAVKARTALRIWQSAAGALAASLLFVLMQPEMEQGQVLDDLDPQPVVAVAALEESTAGSKNSASKKTQRRYMPAAYLRSTAPLLVMRSRALNQDFSELPASTLSGSVTTATVTTNRQLLEEFLPRS